MLRARPSLTIALPRSRPLARAPSHALWQRAQALWREDQLVATLLLGFFACQLFACLWDLPGAHSWENDGIAPRGLFGGLAESFRPGHAHRYPLFHYLLSIVASLPALLLAPLLARSLSGPELVEAVASVPVMSGVALSVKLLSIAMSCATALLLTSYVRRCFGTLAARVCLVGYVLNVSLAYYGRTTNLDGPYVFWLTLALWSHGQLLQRATPGRYARLGLALALAVATKDQAYAAALPIGCAGLYCAWHERARASALGAYAAGLASYLLASGALFNPRGFVARLSLLSGPNNLDYAAYSRDLAGLAQNLADIVRQLHLWWWPTPALLLVVLGVAEALRQALRQRSVAPVLPLLSAISGLVLFTLVVRRADHRFVLPFALAACCYLGLGTSRLLRWAEQRTPLRVGLRAGLAVLAVMAALQAASVVATQWSDGRHQLARWLRAQPLGTRVETYGLPVYLPHFDRAGGYRVTRIEPEGSHFAQLPGLERRVDSYRNWVERGADLLLVPEGFAARFNESHDRPGQQLPAGLRTTQRDADARSFFVAALAGQLPGYQLAFVAEPQLPWPFAALGYEPARVHGSTGLRTLVFARSALTASP